MCYSSQRHHLFQFSGGSQNPFSLLQPGGCDLVQLHNPNFNNGQGLDVHIRTKIVTWWSYIDRAAIRIGDDTIEVQGGFNDEWWWVNGEPNKQKLTINGNPAIVNIGGYKARIRQLSKNLRTMNIDLHNGNKILIKA